MKKTNALLLALLIGMPASGLIAQNQNDGPSDGPPPGQQDGGPGGHHRHHPPMPIIEALDTNKDGVLSADEIANAPAALKTLDKNGDGQLTEDEYKPKHPPGDGPGKDGPPSGESTKGAASDKHPKRPTPPIITALDTNGDGIISADEIANAAASLLKLDKNGDGKLSMDEMMGPRPEGPGGKGGPGGPGGEDGGPGGPGGPDGNPPPQENN